MSDLITGIRQLLQDLIAPDLKSIQAKQDAHEQHLSLVAKHLQEQIKANTELIQEQLKSQNLRLDVMVASIDAFRAEMRTDFALARAKGDMEISREIRPLTERLAILEAKQQAS